MTLDLHILFWMSIVTFILYAIDKLLAIHEKGRIPEALLITFTILDGAFGALCGMMFFRHKTLHRTFLWIVPLMLLLQIAIHVVLRLFVLSL